MRLIFAGTPDFAARALEALLAADDLLAVCLQHEMDHLEGKVFVEYLSRLKQTRIKSKLVKQARETF